VDMDESPTRLGFVAGPSPSTLGSVPQHRSLTVVGSWQALDARTRTRLDDLREHRTTVRWEFDFNANADPVGSPARREIQNSGRTGS